MPSKKEHDPSLLTPLEYEKQFEFKPTGRRERLPNAEHGRLIIYAVGIIIFVGILTLLFWVNDPNNRPNEISDINTVDVDKTSAVVIWITTKPSTSGVMYCGPDGQCKFTVPDTNYVTSHAMLIRNFTPNTKYHITVMSTDKKEMQATKEFDFHKKAD